jgi:hypothetical protein
MRPFKADDFYAFLLAALMQAPSECAGGNAAGFLAPVVGIMLDQFGWLPTLASGSVFAITGAALWLFIDVQRRLGRPVR